MILTEKNVKDVTRPTKVIFGEPWFVSPENFDHEFFGVSVNGRRPQPFPTPMAAEKFANACIEIMQAAGEEGRVQMVDENNIVILDLTP